MTDIVIMNSQIMNSTSGISLQQTFSGSVGIFSHLAQIHLYQERDLKSDNIAGVVYLNVVLLLKT